MSSVPPFEFNREVASVFDDMATRSIPFYWQTQQLIADLFAHLYQFRGVIYDAGCSTGNALYSIAKAVNSPQLKLIGFDSSPDMIQKCRENLGRYRLVGDISVTQTELIGFQFSGAEGVLLNYILQFLPSTEKREVIHKIFEALPKNGFVVISEKTRNPDNAALFDQLYHRFKSLQGYSELEIAQKREALEARMASLSPVEIESELRDAGFVSVNALFQWTHFVTFLAIK